MSDQRQEARRRESCAAFPVFLASCFLASFFLLPGEPYVPSWTLALVGDVMLGRGVAQATSGNWEAAFAEVQPWLAEADVAFANLESPLTTAPIPPFIPPYGGDEGRAYDLQAMPEAVTALRTAGFDIVSLANNHALDAGQAGLAQTHRVLTQAGIVAAGQGESICTPEWCLLAFYAPLTDPRRAVAAVAAADAPDRLLAVSLHWGGEYQAAPSPTQRAFAEALVAAGADLIVGHGPHVLQRVEWIREALVAYSLGNFLFDQPFPDTRQGAILRITLDRGSITLVEAIPTITRYGRVHLAAGDEAAAILTRLRVSTDRPEH